MMPRSIECLANAPLILTGRDGKMLWMCVPIAEEQESLEMISINFFLLGTPIGHIGIARTNFRPSWARCQFNCDPLLEDTPK